MNLKEKANELLATQPSSESEAKKLLLAINALKKEMDDDVKKDINPHYAEIEIIRHRYRDENNSLYQKQNRTRQELIKFIEEENA